MNWFYLFVYPFVLSLIITPVVRILAVKFKVLDHPNERKIHDYAIPLLGGVAIYLSFVIVILCNFHFSRQLKGVLIAETLMMFIGLADDIRPVAAGLKLIGQILAVCIIIYNGVIINIIPGSLFGEISGVVLTIFWVVGITNAFNFLDGLDGLATGLVIISSLVFFVIAFQTHQVYLGYLTVVLAGSASGFYPYNLHPARIFLGDSGSQFLGFFLASIAVMGKWSQHSLSACLIVPVLVLGVFIFDITYISVARIIQGKVRNLREWIEYAGKDHLHHRLLKVGLTKLQTVFFIYLISLCLGLGAIAITGVFGHFILALQAFAIFTILTVLMKIKNKYPGNI